MSMCQCQTWQPGAPLCAHNLSNQEGCKRAAAGRRKRWLEKCRKRGQPQVRRGESPTGAWLCTSPTTSPPSRRAGQELDRNGGRRSWEKSWEVTGESPSGVLQSSTGRGFGRTLLPKPSHDLRARGVRIVYSCDRHGDTDYILL